MHDVHFQLDRMMRYVHIPLHRRTVRPEGKHMHPILETLAADFAAVNGADPGEDRALALEALIATAEALLAQDNDIAASDGPDYHADARESYARAIGYF